MSAREKKVRTYRWQWSRECKMEKAELQAKLAKRELDRAKDDARDPVLLDR